MASKRPSSESHLAGRLTMILMLRRTCRSLALANLQDIQKYITNHPDPCRGAEWYTLFFAFQAALTIMLSVVWEPNHQRAGTWKAMLASTAGWFRGLRSMQEVGASSLIPHPS